MVRGRAGFDGEDETGLAGMPAVADAEGERGGFLGGGEVGEFLLGKLFEGGDGAVVGAEEAEGPIARGEVVHGDAGVVLEEGCGLGEEELAAGVEAAGEHEVGGGLEEAAGGAEGGAPGEEAAVGEGVVGEVVEK